MNRSINQNSMVDVPGGSFEMGSNEYPNESPVRIVSVSAFAIDVFPVTNKRFAKFMESGGYQLKGYWTELGWEYIKSNGLMERSTGRMTYGTVMTNL
jgi:iron(II)-dependent oxidoreductase